MSLGNHGKERAKHGSKPMHSGLRAEVVAEAVVDADLVAVGIAEAADRALKSGNTEERAS
jgi:hypothetical protein